VVPANLAVVSDEIGRARADPQLFLESLCRAFAESLASENASRLSSMQAAEKNIEERLDQLNAQYHHLRQSSSTEELMDVVAGYEVLAGTSHAVDG
jgi:F-type H+-transporting ATPase subunit gamma